MTLTEARTLIESYPAIVTGELAGVLEAARVLMAEIENSLHCDQGSNGPFNTGAYRGRL